MRFPSIIKIPRHQRFHFEPRYYDPIKEEIEEKRSKIRRFSRKLKEGEHGRVGVGARLEGAFKRQAPKRDNAGFLRLSIGFLLFAGVVGFLYFGDIAIYLTVLIVLAFYFFRHLRLR